MHKLNRRDFLKLSMALPATAALSKFAPSLLSKQENQNGRLPNIIIIVLDTLSAKNMSLYGYPKRTTPNLERFAERATVYHAHHSAGNFTVPGTASILTGMYPWTHRAVGYAGLVSRELARRNVFRLIGDAYTKFAFSQNLWAMHLLAQFLDDIDQLLPPSSFSVAKQVIAEKFTGDLNAAYTSMDEFLFLDRHNPPPSLIFGIPERALLRYKSLHANSDKVEYPTGMPSTHLAVYFHIKDVCDGILSALRALPSPYLAYFHLWGVHPPYAPTQRFYKIFRGGWKPGEKPRHALGGVETFHDLLKLLNRYDEYIANFDFELGRLLDQLEQDGILDDSYVLITSDHGELFERGTHGHLTPLLFEALIHVPLIVSAPGQRQGGRIFAPTNSVDILPTLASLTGQEIPEWSEGQPLPGMTGYPVAQRALFSTDSKLTREKETIKNASIAMQQDEYKLVYYRYADYEGYELYDLENDPEELNNIYKKLPVTAKAMREELLHRFDLANQSIRG